MIDAEVTLELLAHLLVVARHIGGENAVWAGVSNQYLTHGASNECVYLDGAGATVTLNERVNFVFGVSASLRNSAAPG